MRKTLRLVSRNAKVGSAAKTFLHSEEDSQKEAAGESDDSWRGRCNNRGLQQSAKVCGVAAVESGNEAAEDTVTVVEELQFESETKAWNTVASGVGGRPDDFSSAAMIAGTFAANCERPISSPSAAADPATCKRCDSFPQLESSNGTMPQYFIGSSGNIGTSLWKPMEPGCRLGRLQGERSEAAAAPSWHEGTTAKGVRVAESAAKWCTATDQRGPGSRRSSSKKSALQAGRSYGESVRLLAEVSALAREANRDGILASLTKSQVRDPIWQPRQP